MHDFEGPLEFFSNLLGRFAVDPIHTLFSIIHYF